MVPSVLAPWERFLLGLDEALEEFGRQNVPGVLGEPEAGAGGDRPGSTPSSSLPAQGAPSGMRLAPDPQRRDDEPDREDGSSPVGRGRGHRHGHPRAVARRRTASRTRRLADSSAPCERVVVRARVTLTQTTPRTPPSQGGDERSRRGRLALGARRRAAAR